MQRRNLFGKKFHRVHRLHQGHVQWAGCAVVHGMPERLLRRLLRCHSMHGLLRR